MRLCEKSSDRTGSPRAGAVDEDEGPVGASLPRSHRHERERAAVPAAARSQRGAAAEDRHSSAASPPIWRRDDLPEAAPGRRAHQSQTRRTALHAREAAGTASAAQEDPSERAAAAGATRSGQRGLVGGFPVRSHCLGSHPEVSGDRRRCDTRGDRGDRRALHGRRAPDADSGWHLFAARTTCRDSNG